MFERDSSLLEKKKLFQFARTNKDEHRKLIDLFEALKVNEISLKSTNI